MELNPKTLDKSYQEWFQHFLKSAPAAFLKHGYERGDGSGMAASKEAIATFLKRVNQDSVILDAGAGATTWIFNKLTGNKVITIDRDKGYLGVVATVVTVNSHRACDARFDGGFPDCDFCFFDYSHTNDRIEFLPLAVNAAKKGVYIDDYDYRESSMEYKGKVDRFAAENNMSIQYCKSSEDRFGRSGAWLLR